MHKIDFLICNYNTNNLIEKCINSLLDLHSHNLDINIYIYDNNSNDDSLIYLKSINNIKIKIFLGTTNLGYGKAINYLYHKSNSEYIFILNPDTVIKFNKTDLSKLLNSENFDTNIFGFKILTPGQKIQQHLTFEPGLFWLCISILRKGFPIYLELFYKIYFKIINSNIKSDNTKFLSGCALLMKRNIFKILNGFNEKYFLYFEDTELLLNAKNKGYFLNETNLIIEHNSSYSVKKSNNKIKTEIYKSALIYYKTNFNIIKFKFGKFFIYFLSLLCICNPINIFYRKNSKYFIELFKVPFNV